MHTKFQVKWTMERLVISRVTDRQVADVPDDPGVLDIVRKVPVKTYVEIVGELCMHTKF